MMDFVSWDDFPFPTEWKNNEKYNPFMFQSTNQTISTTLWLCQNSYGKWPIEIVDLPSYKMVIFYSYVAVYQRVMWLKQCRKRTIPQSLPYRWYKLTIPSHGW